MGRDKGKGFAGFISGLPAMEKLSLLHPAPPADHPRSSRVIRLFYLRRCEDGKDDSPGT